MVSAEEVEDGGGEHQGQNHEAQAAGHQGGNAVGAVPQGLVGLPLALQKIEMDGGADAEEQAHRAAHNGDGIGHGGGRVAQVADPLADEGLVGEVINGAQQGAENGGDGKLHQQLADLFRAQGVAPGRPAHGFLCHCNPSKKKLGRCPI